jgi:hypothetical protein
MADIPVVNYNQATQQNQRANPRWWVEKAAEIYMHIFGHIRSLEQDQGVRRLQWLQFARLYQNQSPAGFFSGVGNNSVGQMGLKDTPAVNVVKSCVDTATSKIGKTKPRPMFLTDNGDYKQQNRAKKLTQYMDGQFDLMGLYPKACSVFRDGCIFGTGALKIYIDKDLGTVACERVLPDELIVDDAEAVYGKPRQLHQKKYLSRDVLIEMFPAHKNKIIDAPLAFTTATRQAGTPDLVRVVESWHLPSSKEASDGLHSICLENVTLFSEEYSKPWFPFVFWSWTSRVAGFWGMGLAEELFGTQLEISKLLRNIQLAMHLVAVPRVWVQNGSVVAASHINNEIGSVVKYTGAKPEFFTPAAMSSEVYEHLRWLIKSAYESTGISQLSANAQKPAGLESAVALREYQDIESERFQVVGQRWEEFFLEATKIIVDLTRDMVDMGIKGKVKVAGKQFMETIKWSEVNMEEDAYVLRCFAANILPTQPAGRLQKVQELVQAGWLSKEIGRKLLDFPDIDASMNQELSSTELCAKMIDGILADGTWMSPEPEMDLAEALTTSQHRLIEARLNGYPEANIELLTRWRETIKAMLPAPEEQAVAAGMAPPTGLAQPQQQSDLIANVPQ